jgi:hypothetical protein
LYVNTKEVGAVRGRWGFGGWGKVVRGVAETKWLGGKVAVVGSGDAAVTQ